MSRRDPLADVNLLELAPVRLAPWEEKDERVVLKRPRPQGRGLRWLGAWLSCQLASQRIRLDPVGSFAWKQLDGTTTVAETARRLRQEFGDEIEPAEQRLGLLVRALRQQGMLAYPGWDEVPEGH